MSEEEIKRKRAEIRRIESRIKYFERMIRERPRLAGIWRYWWHWYRVRRADVYTDLWLERLREIKREVRDELPSRPEDEQIKRAEQIERYLKSVEDGIAVILMELRDTEAIAREREWRIRYPLAYPTMIRWITAVRGRIGSIRRWIRRIREELPTRWKNFVYVIYFAYTKPGEERHLEAHLEGQCHLNPKVQEQVKEIANQLLVEWVAKPITTIHGEVKAGYASPLLDAPGINKPPYEGSYTDGYAVWEWGVQWFTTLDEYGEKHRVEAKMETKETQTLTFEVYDYDYGTVRMYNEYEVPAQFWNVPLKKLKRMVRAGVPLGREWREEEEEEEEE